MAGAGLIALKRRIKSITSTRKITNAMGLVATSKLRKSREKLAINSEYFNSFNNIVDGILSKQEDSNIYTHGNKSNKKLYVALTSDSGLCGGFNANLTNSTMETISKDRDNVVVITVGQKGKTYFAKYKINPIDEIVGIPDLPTISQAQDITNKVIQMYRDGEVGEVYIVYTKFISMVRQTPIVKKVLPLEPVGEKQNNDYIHFEPNVNQLIDSVVKTHITQQAYNCLLNSKASEQASRMTAMDGATKNANDLLDALNLQYNRVRQSVITQEISEIVGGAEAQK